MVLGCQYMCRGIQCSGNVVIFNKDTIIRTAILHGKSSVHRVLYFSGKTNKSNKTIIHINYTIYKKQQHHRKASV